MSHGHFTLTRLAIDLHRQGKNFWELGVGIRFNRDAPSQPLSKRSAERLLGRKMLCAHVKRSVTQPQEIIKRVDNKLYLVSARPKKEN